MPSRAARSLVAFCLPLLLFTAWSAGAQPAFRVADLNPTVVQHSSTIFAQQRLTAFGNEFFFVADDGGIHGAELWRSDGTLAGTGVLKDICPGACSSSPGALTVSNGALFFAANDGVHGPELWRSDGTAEGTAMLTEILPGSPGSWASDLVDADGVLYFFADDGVHGRELWTSDGTAAGTHLVKDIAPGTGWNNGRFLATSGHRLLFAAAYGAQGSAPWVSDGTEEGTVMVADIRPGANAVDPHYDPLISGRDAAPAPQGGFLFAADDGTGTALWLTDGTPGGTARLSAAASPHEMTVFQGTVYFAASDSAAGVELWKSDGTAAGTVRVKDLQAGAGGGDPRELTVAGTRLFFRANDGAHGAELWKSDGSAAGTVQVADLNPGAADAFPFTSGFPMRYQLSAFGGELTFFAHDIYSLQLWRTDGATTTKLNTVGVPGDIPYFEKDTVALGGHVYFLAGTWGTEIWASDGTPAGARSLMDVATSTSSIQTYNGKAQPGTFVPAGDQLFFVATSGSPLFDPWKTDGTPGGTSRIASLPSGESLYRLHPWGNGAILLTSQGIWSSDGTANGTRMLGTGSPSGSPAALNGALFYIAYDPGSGTQRLWKTDGTPAGTSPLALL